VSQPSSINALSLALLVTIALLAAVIALELSPADSGGPASSGTVLATDESVALATGQRFIAPAIGQFSAVLERPLFFQDRQLPAEPPPAAISAAPLLPLRLKLEGVAITSDARVAVLRDTSNNQLLQLAEGMSHDGWLLETVRSNSASFKRGDTVSKLVLDPNGRNGQR